MNIFSDIANLIKTEEGQKMLPLIATAITNVAGNPTVINAVAEGESVLTQTIAQQIAIGQDALKELALDITTLAAQQTAPVAASVIAGTATVPAPAVKAS